METRLAYSILGQGGKEGRSTMAGMNDRTIRRTKHGSKGSDLALGDKENVALPATTRSTSTTRHLLSSLSSNTITTGKLALKARKSPPPTTSGKIQKRVPLAEIDINHFRRKSVDVDVSAWVTKALTI